MKAAGDKYNLKTLTEVMDSAHCQLVSDYVDGLQVGARNFQNFSLLKKKIGQVTADTHQMVLYKRGFAGTIAEWLAATDYITDCGNDNVVLRARYPHLRDGHALHAGHRRRAGHPQAVAVPGVHRRVASGRPARFGAVAGEGRRGCRGRLAHDRGAPQPAGGAVRRLQQLTPAQFRELIAELRELAAYLGRKIV